MDHFSFREAYALSLFNKQNDRKSIDLLLGLYVCDFLDAPENLNIVDYFLHFREKEMGKNLLIPQLEKLRNLNLLSLKKEKLFKNFSLLHFTPSENLNAFILQSLEGHENKQELKEIIEIFNKQLLSFFKSYESKHSKYELRFFWPEMVIPEIYDYDGNLFNRKNYDKEHNKDKYIIGADDLIIKLRKGRVKVKERLCHFNGINHFIKREPSQEFLNFQPPIEVAKKRYISKVAAHTKIEFSTFKVQNKKWKTICIESNKIENVLALSFLINPAHAERLTYTEFLKKYG